MGIFMVLCEIPWMCISPEPSLTDVKKTGKNVLILFQGRHDRFQEAGYGDHLAAPDLDLLLPRRVTGERQVDHMGADRQLLHGNRA